MTSAHIGYGYTKETIMKIITFKITADPDALAGLYKDINCEVTVIEDGQSVHQTTGSTIIRIDPARTTTVATVIK